MSDRWSSIIFISLIVISTAAIGMTVSVNSSENLRTLSSSIDLPEYLNLDNKIFMDAYPELAETEIEGLYLVCYGKPIEREWTESLNDAFVVRGYLPKYTFLIEGERRDVERYLSDNEQVESVHPYSSIFKVDYTTLLSLYEGTEELEVSVSFIQEPLKTISTQHLNSVEEFSNLYLGILDRDDIVTLAMMDNVFRIQPFSEAEPIMEQSGWIIGSHGGAPEVINTRGLTGEGVTLGFIEVYTAATVGGWDTSHGAFDDLNILAYLRKNGSPTDPEQQTDVTGHGTHVAGTLYGNGWNSVTCNDPNDGLEPTENMYHGIAYNADATYHEAGGIPRIENMVPRLVAHDTEIISNSWAYGNYFRYDMGWTSGDPAPAARADQAVIDYDVLLVFGAGNRGYDSSGGSYTYNTGSVNVPAIAKNVIAVGAVYNNRSIDSSGFAFTPDVPDKWNYHAPFSGKAGGSQSLLIKPDLVAPGVDVVSTESPTAPKPPSSFDRTWTGDWYYSQPGTSMATPHVAGAAALLYEYMKDNELGTPSAALAKAMLINTAEETSYGYNITHYLSGNPIKGWQITGWGRVHIGNLIDGLEWGAMEWWDQEEALYTHDSFTTEYNVVDDSVPLKVTLTYTDVVPELGCGNDPLVNDLDLEVVSPSGIVYRGNVFDGNWARPNAVGAERHNNVENVFVEEPEVGEWTLTVRGYNVPQGPQDFALVASNMVEVIPGEPPEISVSRPSGGEVFHARTMESIQWSTSEGDDPIDHVNLYYSADAGTNWKPIALEIDDTGSYLWNVPNEMSEDCVVKAVVRDTARRTGEGLSQGYFEIVGVTPESPENLAVEHYGDDEPEVPLEEDFSGVSSGSIPSGWTRTSTWWGASTTNEAGGEAPELRFGNLPSGSGVFRCYTPAIDTSDFDTLNLTFRHYYNSFMGSITLRVQTSTDGSSWSDIWSVSTSSSISAQQLDFLLDHTHGVGSSTLYVSFTVDGTANNMRRWAVDDVMLYTMVTGDGNEHNLITWDASPDDPAEINRYNIYRSDHSDGIFDHVGSVDADGSVSYSFIDEDKGTADEILWWYIVRAEGINGLEDGNNDAIREPGPTETFDIPLIAGGAADGWNFVSFNLVPLSSSLETILSDIDGDYDRVMYYDASTGRWSSYMPGRAVRYNNLQSWNRDMGIWIRATSSITLTIEGSLPVSTDISLYPGWNMVGLPSAASGTHGIPAEVDAVGYFDASARGNLAYSFDPSTFTFEPGKAYWIRNPTEAVTIWQVDYDD